MSEGLRRRSRAARREPRRRRARRGVRLAAVAAGLALAGCAGTTGVPGLDEALGRLGPASTAPLDTSTIVAGLKDALRVGTENAVRLTSATDGFLGNQLIRIALPESLDPMVTALRTVGFGPKVDALEVAMNRAAERAAGEAGQVFWNAIRQMSIDDARGILAGGDTAATDYFRRVTSAPLRQRFEPIVAEKMQEVGLVRAYDQLADRYRAIPFVGSASPPPEIQGYVTDRTLDGLFTVLGDQERQIRTDPAARVNDLLRRVFGS